MGRSLPCRSGLSLPRVVWSGQLAEQHRRVWWEQVEVRWQHHGPWVPVLGWSWSVWARGRGDPMAATQSEDPPLDRLLPLGVPRELVDCILSLCVCWVGSWQWGQVGMRWQTHGSGCWGGASGDRMAARTGRCWRGRCLVVLACFLSLLCVQGRQPARQHMWLNQVVGVGVGVL